MFALASNEAARHGELLDGRAALAAFGELYDTALAWSITGRELREMARDLVVLRRFAAPAVGRVDARAVVCEAIQRGGLQVWRSALGRSAVQRDELDTEALMRIPLASTLLPKTWIEIELTDMEGEPIAGERYWIQLPDGTVREGTLDRYGRAYFGDLEPGEALIRWPNLDDAATLAAPRLVRSQPISEPPPPTPLTWIEVELVDMEGAPIPYEPYWIKLPEGTVHEGNLDAYGRVRFDEIKSGTALIRWPAMDDNAVVLMPTAPVGAAPPRQSAPSRALTWIEVELVDMEGAPISYEPYWIKLPDGTVHEGNLDAYGRVRFDDILPGEALIRWPEVDEEAATLVVPSAVAAIEPSVPAVVAPETTWIEVELVDMEGTPISYEPYELILPDGSTRSGTLDAYGRARLEGISQGEAVIRWPDIDEEAVSPASG